MARGTLLLSMLQVFVCADDAQRRPLAFHHFAADDRKEGVRTFSHSEYLLLPNYTTVELRWDVHVDPDTILTVDTEHEHGVRLAACQPNQLVLHLPPSHVSKVKAWKHVTAGQLLHGCEHLQDQPMYHRIKEVEFTKHHDTPKGGTTAVLTTEELNSPADLIPRINFEYSSIPVESLPFEEQEAFRQLYDERRAATEELTGRRLPGLDLDGNGGYGDFQQSKAQLKGFNNIRMVGGDDRQWRPLSHAKFGWNWNYRTNTVRNPQFKLTIPNMRGMMLVKKPYLKLLGGLRVSFKSKWDDVNPFQTPPHVNIEATLDGTADINLDIAVEGSSSKDSKLNPFGTATFNLFGDNPAFKWARKIYWFENVPKEWSIGGVPISLIPGLHCGLKMYHNGLFQGSMRGGFNTKAKINAVMTYDSLTGFNVNFQVDALNMRVLPPTWMIFTKHFEMGAYLQPELWVKGHVGPTYGKICIAAKPRISASILAAGENALGIQDEVVTKELVVYPFRAINLPTGQEWSVGIKANGRSIMTSTKMSTGLGVLEFDDYVDHFRFGMIDEKDVQRQPIYVVLFRDGQFQVGMTVEVYCQSLVNSICTPNPTKAIFDVDGRSVVVQLTMAWHDDPTGFLEQHIRTVSVVLPSFTLDAVATQKYNDFVQSYGTPKVEVKFTRLGKSITTEATARQNGNNMEFNTKLTQCLGIQWLDAWRVNFGSIVGQQALTDALEPLVQVTYITAAGARTLAGEGRIRSIAWDRVLLGEELNKKNERFNLNLVENGAKTTQLFANAEIGFNTHNVKYGSRFLYPGWSQQWKAGTAKDIYWSTDFGSTLKPGQAQQFTIEIIDSASNSLIGSAQQIQSTCAPGPLEIPTVSANDQGSDGGFVDYGDECHFKAVINIPALNNKVIHIRISWANIEDSTRLNVMYSPGMTIVQTLTPRKLHAEGEWNEKSTEEDGDRQLEQLQTNQLHAICTKKKLTYRLHLGVDYRVRFIPLRTSAGVVTPFHWLNALGKNFLDTGNRNMWQSTPVEAFLNKLLPPGLCSNGVCAGELPGCPGEVAHSKFLGNMQYKVGYVWPPTPNTTLELLLSRPFEWTKDSKATARGALAFGMALMPEVVRITSLVLEQLFPSDKDKEHGLHPGDVVQDGDILRVPKADGSEMACRWTAPSTCINEFIYRSGTVTGCTMKDHHFRGWCSVDRTFAGNWRNCDLVCTTNGQTVQLNQEQVDGIVNKMRKEDETPHLPWGKRKLSDVDQPVKANRFVVSFQEGSLHYGLTDDFIRTLIRREAFRGFEDGHEHELGEAKIVGFRIHSGETPVAGKAELLPAPTDVERFEVNYTRKPGDPVFEMHRSVADLALAEGIANGSYALPLLAVGAGIIVLIAAITAVGCCLWKSRGKSDDYSKVSAPEDTVME